jgi:PKD repeat protein
LNFKGGTAATSPEAEGWAISKPLNLRKVLPDLGVALKNMTTVMESYYYIYTAPGNYTATFEVSNTSRYDSKAGVYEVPVTIR